MGWTASAPGQVTLVTAEERPLGALGHAATELITNELTTAGVELITGVEAFDGTSTDGSTAARLRLVAEERDSREAAALTARPTRRPDRGGVG